MRRRAVPAACLLTAALLVFGAAEATAQIHHLDEFPWYTVTDSLARRGVVLRYDQFRDQPTGWRTDRLGAILHTAVGRFGVVFVQADFLRFDTAGLSVLDRWPQLAQPDDEGNVDTDWPRETIVGGFGRPEVGLLAPLALPLVGAGHLGILAGLPVGRDELYPMSSASLPLRLDWRRPLGRPGGLVGAVRIGYERTFDSGRDFLTADAFPGGLRYGLELGLVTKPDRGLTLAWSARELSGGHHSRRAGVSGWLPLGEGHALQLQLARELGGRNDRYATWIAGISWRLRSPRSADESEPAPRGQNAPER